MKELKLYHLNPNDYSEEWYAMSYSREDAMKAIAEKVRSYSQDIAKGLDEGKLLYKYTLDEYGIGEVISSEIA